MGKHKSYEQIDKSKSGHKRMLLFLVTSLVLVLTISFTRFTTYLNFCFNIGEFLETKWERFIDIYGENQMLFWVIASNGLTISLYWIVGGAFLMLDLKSQLCQYKVQPGTNKDLNLVKIRKASLQVLINQIVLLPVSVLLFKIMQWRGLPELKIIPSLYMIIFDLVSFTLIHEISFYYMHRLMHHPMLYKNLHKQHHEWTSPIAIIAAYCNPIEHVFVNIMPLVLGPIVMGSAIFTTLLWYSIAIVGTLSHHSGYHIPLMLPPEFHDFHHLKFTECYGNLGLLDYLHGTDLKFRQTSEFQRHRLWFSTVPIREIYPDLPAEKKNI